MKTHTNIKWIMSCSGTLRWFMCDKSVEPEIREFLQRENSMKIGAGKERKTRK